MDGDEDDTEYPGPWQTTDDRSSFCGYGNHLIHALPTKDCSLNVEAFSTRQWGHKLLVMIAAWQWTKISDF